MYCLQSLECIGAIQSCATMFLHYFDLFITFDQFIAVAFGCEFLSLLWNCVALVILSDFGFSFTLRSPIS